MIELKKRYDAVIIGGGHNGLVAANYLAMAGHSVLLLEANDQLGGATVSRRIFPDHEAKISRYAYLISLLPTSILDDLGIEFKTRRRATASFTPYIRADGTHDGLLMSNVDPAISRASFERLVDTPRGWDRYEQWLGLQHAIAQIAWPTLTEPLKTRASFERSLAADQRIAWDWLIERPLGEAIEHFIDDDLIRGLVMTDGKIGVFTHPHDPTLLQNRCFLYHVIGRGTGEWQVPIGGIGALVDALVNGATKHGCRLLTSTAAKRVHVAERDAEHEIEFEHQEQTYHVAASRVLINAGPQTFASLLREPYTPTENDQGSVMKVNMLLKRLPKIRTAGITPADAFAGSLHLDEGYLQMIESYRAAAAGRVPIPCPSEVYCHTLTDSSILSKELAGQGYHTLTLFGLDAPYHLFDHDHDARRDAIVASYLESLNACCDESFDDCLARNADGSPCIEVKTPHDLEREVGLDLGNIFHNELSWFFTDDPSKEGTWGVETAYPRIYRCGSSALRGGAVSGIPGRNAATKILSEQWS